MYATKVRYETGEKVRICARFRGGMKKVLARFYTFFQCIFQCFLLKIVAYWCLRVVFERKNSDNRKNRTVDGF